MATNAQIILGIFNAVKALGYPTAYPDTPFDPPAAGVWLELIYLPNGSQTDPVNSRSAEKPEGIFRVNVCNRANTGAVVLEGVADTVAAAFSPATVIAGDVKTVGYPDREKLDADSGIIRSVVSVRYG